MATTTEATGGVQLIDVDRIAIPSNVRELDAQHVDALAGSIKLRGLRVPVIVRPGEKPAVEFELVAGFHRVAADKQAPPGEIRAEIREADTEAARVAIWRTSPASSSTPTRRPRRSRRCSTDGLTEDGAAQALGWPKARSPRV